MRVNETFASVAGKTAGVRVCRQLRSRLRV